ncbi:MAG: hypothetical protein ACRD59_16280 [Candidatus Acidiferrales bacterium]
MSSKPEEKKENTARELLRHAVATLAYRGGKAIRGAPEGFTDFKTSEKTRTPGQIVAHLGDLFDWALSMARGKQEWHDSKPIAWDAGAKRLFASLQAFDDYLASSAPLGLSAEELLQGPVADALTHVGQIAMLRGIYGSPIRAENYSKAEIVAGRVGAEQVPPQREF